MNHHLGQERQAFQATLDNQSVVDTGTLRRISLALRRGPAEPASLTPLVLSPPPVPRAAASVTVRPGRRRHARPRRRHRGEPAPRSLRTTLLVLVLAPAACAVGVLVPLLR
ncbi:MULTISPECIES: hypothetical protein [Streptomyces]|uniref:DUF3040 domain-containing protein n=1 Tax=Streptomyces luteosporeus TaxID=173856 RepID=A0ABP6GAW7_9ACTN